jgi:hypothetical protein
MTDDDWDPIWRSRDYRNPDGRVVDRICDYCHQVQHECCCGAYRGAFGIVVTRYREVKR